MIVDSHKTERIGKKENVLHFSSSYCQNAICFLSIFELLVLCFGFLDKCLFLFFKNRCVRYLLPRNNYPIAQCLKTTAFTIISQFV